jgi:methionine-rich copper-binding protein CopC
MTSVRVGARALAWVAVGIAALLALPIAPASAHATLVGSDPKDGATVRELPSEVSLEFSEAVGSPAYVEVTASDGTDVGSGDPEVLDAIVTMPLASEGPAGTYTLAYRVVSADGHPISGELTFDVTTGSTAGSSGSAAEAESGSSGSSGSSDSSSGDEGGESFVSSHVEHFVVAGVGLLAGAVLVGLGLRARA